MDILPTCLEAAGIHAGDLELDGVSILSMVTEGKPTPHPRVFWEMNQQTAVRQGPWKLVLNGLEVEGGPPADTVHLANLELDPGERTNLAGRHPDLREELKTAAAQWRQAIEACWQTQWLPNATGTTTHTPSA
jgi:arylsulfatase A-like enzyme